MRRRAIRKLCADFVKGLDLGAADTVDDVYRKLCDAVAARLGQPVSYRVAPLADGITGMWATDVTGAHAIILSPVRSPLHQLTIMLHEIGHILCGHQPVKLMSPESLRALYPNLSPETLRLMAINRTTVDSVDEADAEEVGGRLFDELTAQLEDRIHAMGLDLSDTDSRLVRTYYMFGFSPGDLG
ncbi:hypothetical protein [Kutzneria buriramensis]|nr:hypothetical protein [Kutzneria buriramensis]